MRSSLQHLVLALAAAPLASCSLLDAATADRPSQTQMSAVGDIFTSIGAFVAVMKDPLAATTSDLADMHATAPYRTLLDPTDAGGGARRATERAPLDPGCVVVGEGTASWDCDFTMDGAPCHAVGQGQDLGGGRYSGTSTATCDTLTVEVTATDLQFDQAAGVGSGRVAVRFGQPSLGGWATLDIAGLGFCTDEASPAPDQGTIDVDGQGPLDGLPFDPLTIEFTDQPVCGTALIR